MHVNYAKMVRHFPLALEARGHCARRQDRTNGTGQSRTVSDVLFALKGVAKTSRFFRKIGQRFHQIAHCAPMGARTSLGQVLKGSKNT